MLDVLFGAEFAAALSAIIILGATETMRALFGPGIILMNMTRREGTTVGGFAFSLVVSTLVAWVLIPSFGVDGAAWGMFFGTIGMSVYLWQKSRRDLKLDPAVIVLPICRDNS